MATQVFSAEMCDIVIHIFTCIYELRINDFIKFTRGPYISLSVHLYFLNVPNSKQDENKFKQPLLNYYLPGEWYDPSLNKLEFPSPENILAEGF